VDLLHRGQLVLQRLDEAFGLLRRLRAVNAAAQADGGGDGSIDFAGIERPVGIEAQLFALVIRQVDDALAQGADTNQSQTQYAKGEENPGQDFRMGQKRGHRCLRLWMHQA
jgi:hypothetical protein